MIYHYQWLGALDFAHKTRKAYYPHRGRPHKRCEEKGLWEEICAQVAFNLGANPQSLLHLDEVFGQSEEIADKCDVCRGALGQWRNDVHDALDMLPKFSTLV